MSAANPSRAHTIILDGLLGLRRGDGRLGGGAGERRLARKHLVGDDAERKQVRAVIDREARVAEDLLAKVDDPGQTPIGWLRAISNRVVHVQCTCEPETAAGELAKKRSLADFRSEKAMTAKKAAEQQASGFTSARS